MATIREIARKSGYSPATVSRLLNDDPTFSITAEARTKILKTARQLGYDHSQLTKSDHYKVGALFAVSPQQELEDTYFNDLRRSIIKNSEQANFDFEFFNNLNEISHQIDGLLAIGNFSEFELSQLANLQTKCVFVDGNPDPSRFTSVQPNLQNIIEQAINLFREKGYDRIGYIGGKSWNQKSMDARERYFESYMYMLGLLDPKNVFIGKDFTVETGYQLGRSIAELFLPNELPQGIIIGSDSLAIGVLQAFNEHQISIPASTEIISINDIDVAKYVSPPLTTFHIDVDQLGKVATETLHDMLTVDDYMPRQILLSSRIMMRRSFIKDREEH